MTHGSALLRYFLAAPIVAHLCACGGTRSSVSPSGADAGETHDAAPEIPPTADYEKQHTLLLLGQAPPPGQTGTSSIYVVRGDGTSKTLLTDDGATPSWTPDGAVIFVSQRSGSQQIWIMSDDGSNAHQVGTLADYILPLMPQIGQNGLIVFMGADTSGSSDAGGDTNVGIWIMQKDGSAPQELTIGMQPSLARSGTWIAYTLETEDPYHREIWRINTDGTGKQALTSLGDPDYPDGNAPNISPDESTVAFFSGKESDKGAAGFAQSVFTFGHRNVAIVPAAGGARTTLTPCHPVTTQAELDATNDTTGDCVAADNPAWSPDGKWLVFDTGFKSGTETWMVDLAGNGFQKYYPDSRGTVRAALKAD